ncbi:MAG: lactate utilization protein [Desulfovibrionaceae bacterium]|nr:lactate utilization protein [Desulfovibrionaceae bacterium]
MPEINQELVEAFKAKAALVNATVVEKQNLAEALQYAVSVCETKAPAQLLANENVEKGPLGPNGCPTRVTKILAAPELSDEDFASLSAQCEGKNIACVREGLRGYLAGIDVGLTSAMLGVAASGTCMVNTDNEDARLAGMISEFHVLLLHKSQIYPDLPSIVSYLRERMSDGKRSYTTFITGPSRTADIERVGAIGVHGPLELHIILLEG